MSLLDVVSQPVGEDGATFGSYDALTASLTSRELLIRETVQNAWDARDPDRPEGQPVLFHVWGDRLEGERAEAVRQLLGTPTIPNLPGKVADIPRESPVAVLAADDIDVVTIADRWTVGLDGPTIPGRIDFNGQRTRFADFLRNLGRPDVGEQGNTEGGAFGIGKTVLWRFSRCSTVIVHTKTRGSDGRPEERVLGKTIGPAWDEPPQRYTGRHYFGRASAARVETIFETDRDFPAIHAALDQIGMPPYPEGSFGTTCIIVGAEVGEDMRRSMEGLRQAVRWQVWPKYTPLPDPDGGVEMAFDIRDRGTSLPLTPVDADPEVGPYARALRDALNGSVVDGVPMRGVDLLCHRPIQRLGGIRIEPIAAVNDRPSVEVRIGLELDEDDPLVSLPTWGEHIALVRRAPLLLVGYTPISAPPPDEHTVRCGVFVNDEDESVNGALRTAEPPAHDRWVPGRLPPRSRGDSRRTFVKQIVDGIESYAARLGQPEPEPRPATEGLDLIGWGEELLKGMPAQQGIAGLGPAVTSTPPPGDGSGSKTARARPIDVQVFGRRRVDDDIIHTLHVGPHTGLSPSDLQVKVAVSAPDPASGSGSIAGDDVPGVNANWIGGSEEIDHSILEVRTPLRYVLDVRVLRPAEED